MRPTCERLYRSKAPGPFKDGINDFVVDGRADAVDRLQGTKCAAHVKLTLPARGRHVLRLRWRPSDDAPGDPFADHDAIFARRIAEADEFYAALQTCIADPDARLVQRQALAGMLWSKQFYRYDVRRWLEGDPLQPPPPPERLAIRNSDWLHLNNRDIISMPDTWEYPWYASWDLAFQAVTFALIDPDFAKQQLLLLTHEWFMHPNGAAAGVRVGVRRGQPAGARLGRLACVPYGRGAARQARLRVPGACLPQTDDEFHRLGQSPGRRRAGTFSRAASSGWTISACSTAARNYPWPGGSTSRTAPPGWRCTP